MNVPEEKSIFANIKDSFSNAFQKVKETVKPITDRANNGLNYAEYQANEIIKNTGAKINDGFNNVKEGLKMGPSTPSNQVAGRRRRTKRRKGGNLATNAGHVYGLQVAKPTYWIKGGKRNKKTSRKTTRKVRSRKSRSRKH